MDLAAVRQHAREACQSSRNIFGPAFFEEHLEVVAGFGVQLAARLNADPEVLEAAAYLHDLSAVCDSATLPVHAKASADLAIGLLTERGFQSAFAARVADAIALHSAPLQTGAASPEAVCLSNADVLARIARPAYWLYFAFKIRNLPFADGRTWLRSLCEEQWRVLIAPARELVGEQYSRTMDLLRD
jgi:HD superfamily phosphodiesterase